MDFTSSSTSTPDSEVDHSRLRQKSIYHGLNLTSSESKIGDVLTNKRTTHSLFFLFVYKPVFSGDTYNNQQLTLLSFFVKLKCTLSVSHLLSYSTKSCFFQTLKTRIIVIQYLDNYFEGTWKGTIINIVFIFRIIKDNRVWSLVPY